MPRSGQARTRRVRAAPAGKPFAPLSPNPCPPWRVAPLPAALVGPGQDATATEPSPSLASCARPVARYDGAGRRRKGQAGQP